MNKKVLITGAAKGLGKSTAIEFAKHGYDLILTYLTSEEEAYFLKNELEKKFLISVELHRVDFTIDEDIDRLVSHIDRLDVLVNNAAYNDDCDVLEKRADVFAKILRVNLIAPFLLAQKLYPVLKESKGCIINIASTNGIDTMYPESLDYDASKAGLINLSRNLARAFKDQIRINVIAPGWIDTEVLANMDPRFKESEIKKSPIGRFMRPEEVAKEIYNFTINETTGKIVRVDGGPKF